jgi:hypothetical protein
MTVVCYPCSTYTHPCILDEPSQFVCSPAPVAGVRLREALGEPAAGCAWFDVALWRDVSRDLFPLWEGYMQAPAAFPAIEGMMRFYHLWSVSYASARALDGSLVYRAHRVWVLLDWEEGAADEP